MPPRGAFPRVGRLLGVVRKLVAFGTNLITTLQRGTSAQRCVLTMLTFGTKDLALIIARIKCGLQRAAALEARLNAYVTRGRDLRPLAWRLSIPRVRTAAPDADAPDADAPDADTTGADATGAATPPPAVRSEVLARLPSAEEIAEQVRTRPLGTVIGDICRDLGLLAGMMDDALWRDLTDAAAACGISLCGFIRDSSKPVFGDRHGEVDIPLTAWPDLDTVVAAAGRPP
jgi:hypothetical protein